MLPFFSPTPSTDGYRSLCHARNGLSTDNVAAPATMLLLLLMMMMMLVVVVVVVATAARRCNSPSQPSPPIYGLLRKIRCTASATAD